MKKPITNTEGLLRHVAREFPEVKKHQIAGVVSEVTSAIMESLLTQAATGSRHPKVTIRHLGRFSLTAVKGSSTRNLKGDPQEIPQHWRVTFRPSRHWKLRTKRI